MRRRELLLTLATGTMGARTARAQQKAMPVIGYLNPTAPGVDNVRDMKEAARAKEVQLPILNAGTEGEIDAAFTSLAELHAGALVVAGDAFFANRREQMVSLASRHAVPAIYMWNDFAVAGGLISYGINNIAMFRQAGIYAGKILNGAKPTDLPVQQPTRFELVVNLKTAKALGLTVPPSILARADEVIEQVVAVAWVPDDAENKTQRDV